MSKHLLMFLSALPNTPLQFMKNTEYDKPGKVFKKFYTKK